MEKELWEVLLTHGFTDKDIGRCIYTMRRAGSR